MARAGRELPIAHLAQRPADGALLHRDAEHLVELDQHPRAMGPENDAESVVRVEVSENPPEGGQRPVPNIGVLPNAALVHIVNDANVETRSGYPD